MIDHKHQIIPCKLESLRLSPRTEKEYRTPCLSLLCGHESGIMATGASSETRQAIVDTWGWLLKTNGGKIPQLETSLLRLNTKDCRATFLELAKAIEDTRSEVNKSTVEKVARSLYEAIREAYFLHGHFVADKISPSHRVRDYQAVIKKIEGLTKDIKNLDFDELMKPQTDEYLAALNKYGFAVSNACAAVELAPKTANTLHGALARNIHVVMIRELRQPKYALIAKVINALLNDRGLLTDKNIKDLVAPKKSKNSGGNLG